MFQGSLFGPSGIFRQASRVYRSGTVRPPSPQIPRNAASGLVRNSKFETHLDSSILGNLGMKLGLVSVGENVSLPSALSFRSSIHSGKPFEVEEGKIPEPVDSLQGLHGETGNFINGQRPFYQPQAEAGRAPRSLDDFGQLRQGMVNDVNRRPPPYGGLGMTRRPVDFGRVSNQESGNVVNGIPPLNAESRTLRSMDFVQGLLQEGGNVLSGRSRLYPPQGGDAERTYTPMGYGPPGQGLYRDRDFSFGGQPQLESNADIVHIKVTRNNSYVTLTDSKGNKKVGISSAMASGKGEKPGRYSAEAAAEYVGRRARQMKVRSVVVKVSGFTFFRRKRDAILAFKDGYSNSRGNVNPIVYIEDTTRKPHNGCRLPKKRRV